MKFLFIKHFTGIKNLSVDSILNICSKAFLIFSLIIVKLFKKTFSLLSLVNFVIIFSISKFCCTSNLPLILFILLLPLITKSTISLFGTNLPFNKDSSKYFLNASLLLRLLIIVS